MDKISKKMIKTVLFISLVSMVLGAVLASSLLTIPMAISIFFGAILGFFTPWVVALLAYSVYAMSNPTIAFKDEIKKPKKD